MLTWLFVQCSNSTASCCNGPVSHAGVRFVVLSLGSITLICGVFLLLDAPIPEWFVILGRWLPAAIALLVVRAVGSSGENRPGGVAAATLYFFALRPGGWGLLLRGCIAAVASLLLVHVLGAAVIVALGLAVPQSWPQLGQAAILLIPMIVVFSVSTLGEEAAWRGYLQGLLRGWGFWRASVTVAAIWVLFHIPLHTAMAIQGTIPWTIAGTSTLGLFPLGLFLSAVVSRFGSVWPAVVAHALPLTALNLLSEPDALPVRTHWTLSAVTASLVFGAACLFVLRPARIPAASRAGRAASDA